MGVRSMYVYPVGVPCRDVNGCLPMNVWTNTGLHYVGGRRWVVGVRICTSSPRYAILGRGQEERRR